MKVLNYGIKKELLNRYIPDELMKKNRLRDDRRYHEYPKINNLKNLYNIEDEDIGDSLVSLSCI